ncbi:hypothetical protein BDQ94DRAFT_176594 [Aspergillus welwitschiae]|uniref:MEI5 protein n=1 Tax=Aspergillus welwitschiae TaxID=1341132 RepID=A0A3F3PIJ7_9EURO|nr:hypothetical protein BDQ94DRAFT_176594 [Aspergillus welwitschiae]RDH26166.1 hypothetical protein BDQ94DRAFT_176594 [Aspergillus welwitschiae]
MPFKSLTSPSVPMCAPLDTQAVRELFNQFKSLASTAGYGTTLAVYDENAKLYGQLKSKDSELENLMGEINERERKKETALNEIALLLQRTIEDKEKLISERDKRIGELEKQVKKLQSDNTKEMGKLADSQKDVTALQNAKKEKEDTIDKMKSLGTDLKEKLSTSKKRVKELEEQVSMLKGTLATTQGRLTKLEGFAAGHHEVDEESLVEGFIGLWEYAKTELYPHLNVDFPSETLREIGWQDISPWDRLRHCDLVRANQVPLPCSNTSVSKQMRFSVILAILAREIAKHIFQPTYITPTEDYFEKALSNLAATNSERESFCRSILLSIDPETQARICLKNVQSAVNNVSAYLDELLPEDQRSAFLRSLSKVIQKAVDIRKPVQRAQRRYVPDFESPHAEDEWEAFTFPTVENPTTETNANQKSPNNFSLTVFPRICVIENNTCTAFTTVILLNSSHYQWTAAATEMSKEPPSPTIGRVLSLWRKGSHNRKNLPLPNGGPTKRSKV